MSIAEILRARGIQPSQQRICIYKALAANKSHPSADELFSLLSLDLPTLSRTTVFSSLDIFYRHGLAQRLALSGSELRYDADMSRHAHFYCRACGAVLDLPGVDVSPPPSLPPGFIAESHQCFVEGLCPDCAQN